MTSSASTSNRSSRLSFGGQSPLEPLSAKPTYNVYKLWFSQPAPLPPHLALALVPTSFPDQSSGICYHLFGSFTHGWKIKIIERDFERSERFLRKEKQEGVVVREALRTNVKRICEDVKGAVEGEGRNGRYHDVGAGYGGGYGTEERDCARWVEDVIWEVRCMVTRGRYPR
ncbi:MAG: hypothetical protein M1817_001833 [Caeruleum heppii]|nr:MAG: hypothetical protein M1817_001833 [Caeruleum heppii]